METPKHNILIVDDNFDWQLTFKGILLEAGYDIQTAGSIEEAIKKLESTKFDLALLDIRFDESDESDDAGMKLAEEISQRWASVKVVFATGYANDEYIKKAMRLKDKKKLAVGFVQKQSVENLVDIIRKALK